MHHGVGPLALYATAAGIPAGAGVVGFIQHHQVPGLSVQHLLLAIPAPQQMTGNQHTGFRRPAGAVHRPGCAAGTQGRGLPVQGSAGVDGPVEGEFLPQLPLPLPEDGGWRHHQDALRPAAQPGLAQQQTGLNRFAQTHFVGDQQPGRPALPEPLKGSVLVGPWGDGAGGFPNALATGQVTGGHVEHVIPDNAAALVNV